MKSLVLSIVFCCFASSVHSSVYQECENFPVENIDELVSVSKCKDKICPLKKGTKTDLEIKFNPDQEVKQIFNKVSAGLGTLNLPFLGVDGKVADDKVFNEDGKTNATFPLEAGKHYIYKNQIDVLKIFPSIKVTVHWELIDKSGKTIACFEVPAKIES